MIGFNGGLIGKDRTTSLTEAKGVWTLDEQLKAERSDNWPILITSFQYIKWRITAVRSASAFIQAAEFGLMLGVTPTTMSGATITVDPAGAADFPAGTRTVDQLKDGIVGFANKWITSITDNPLPISIVFNMGTSVQFDGYRWATGGDATERDPVTWTIEGSANNSTYTTLDTRTNYAVTTNRNTYETFVLP